MKHSSFIVFFIHMFVVSFTVELSAQHDTSNQKATALALQLESGAFETSHYNTACYFALAGNSRLALTFLRQAVQDGFNQPKVLLEDTDLESLHSEQEWQVIVESVRRNESRKKYNDQLFFNKATFWESSFFKTPFRENISEEEKVAGLSKLWSELKYNFVNFDLIPRIDIDSLYFAYLPKVKQTHSTLEYYKVLKEMCARLDDGHTIVHPPTELQNQVYARPLLRTRLIEDKVLIVDADSSLLSQGIEEGMEIVMVNKLVVKKYASTFVAPYQSSSTTQDKILRTYDYALLAGAITQPISLKLRNENGRISDHLVRRVSPPERSERMSYPAVDYKKLPDNIIYLAINSFATDSGFKFFRQKFAEIAASNAIILDLRNNGGGSTDWRILSSFIDTATQVYATYSREYNPTYRAWKSPQKTWFQSVRLSPNKSNVYRKPVVILTSARTFSAAEDFVAVFKSLKRGLIIGEATGGSTGQPLAISLPGNITAQICTKRDQYPNGDDFVGKGIQPDIVVTTTVSDFRNGVDSQLQAALNELRTKLIK